LDRTHHLLVCADGGNLWYEETNAMKRNIEALLDTGEEVGVKVNAEN
jgi:hypothetical protein